jgi:glutamate synthase (NADPH/NADH) small chain
MSSDNPDNLNSKYAWRDVSARDLPKRAVPERIADFLEIYGLYDERTAREQANRCIQCPNPSCVGGCPLCSRIPEWMRLAAEGRFLEAAAVLGEASNLAEICARLCPSDRMCEGNCIINGRAEPVAIRAIEQFLSEYALHRGHCDLATAPPNGFRVGVVGSGLGGLTCADELARRGCAVTVFEEAPVAGGLLTGSLPAFRLEQSIVQRRIEMLRRRGVDLRVGVKLWKELTLGRLREEFDAVYLGPDWRRARSLDLPGGGLEGSIQAMSFIQQTAVPAVSGHPPFEVAGKRVAVIGAGDTAMDCLRTAIRSGAREAVCIYRREEADMPCSRREYQNAVEEGARFIFRAAPVAVVGDVRGRVSGLRLVRTELGKDIGEARRPFELLAGSEFDLEADWVMAAIGFEPAPLPQMDDSFTLALNDRGAVLVDGEQRTSAPGVYAGGDLVRGPCPGLQAVRDARQAAEHIHRFLFDLRPVAPKFPHARSVS